MKKKTILVTGGAGYIGSHANHMLHLAGYQTIVLDNLSSGNRKAVSEGTFIQGDINDKILLNKIFSENSIDAVMHFAAFIDVGESIKNPLKYYQNNVAASLNLFQIMLQHGVNKIVFSSTAAVIGNPIQNLIDETHACVPINPYGHSKLMVETILQDLAVAYDLHFCILRYFNAAGGDPEGKRKNYSDHQSNLIPRILNNLKQGNATITIFGTDYPTPDGTCIRDYIHIDDLGRAHILAMEHLWKGKSSLYHLGTGSGYSVRDVIAIAEKVTGKKIHAIEGDRRPGDPPILVANSAKAQRELNWEPRYSSLENMIADAWKAQENYEL